MGLKTQFDIDSILHESTLFTVGLIKLAVRAGKYRDKNGFVWKVTTTNTVAVEDLQTMGNRTVYSVVTCVRPARQVSVFWSVPEILEVTFSLHLDTTIVNFSHKGDLDRALLIKLGRDIKASNDPLIPVILKGDYLIHGKKMSGCSLNFI